ncbi:unnamed protein product, partial [Mesorhabditis belari]|uniref:Uncharacterized protein n=1 Tax=Mesorhabditis belari TaxID=2138241 RepID=A0AAF3J573_9BILA
MLSQNVKDILTVLALTTILFIIFIPIFCLAQQPTLVKGTKIDVDPNLASNLNTILDWSDRSVVFLSLLTTPLAMYYSATNDRLTLPIRVLATAENFTKFLFAIFYTLNQFCSKTISSIGCSVGLKALPDYFFDGNLNGPNRPLIVNGFYSYFTPTLIMLPYFMACSLDFVNNKNMRKLKKSGRATRTESLLMIQMIASSVLALWNTLIAFSLQLLFSLFFGRNFLSVLISFFNFMRALLFYLVESIITILLLRKPREKARTMSLFTANFAQKHPKRASILSSSG